MLPHPTGEPRDLTRTFTLTYRERPWLLNAERAGGDRGIGGHFGRSALTSEWRTEYTKLCRIERVPAMDWISVEAQQICATENMPDIGNCYPAIKAAIDGIVDAEVIPDDRGDPYLRGIMIRPPVSMGYDALILRISGPLCSVQERRQRQRDVEARLLRQAMGKR